MAKKSSSITMHPLAVVMVMALVMALMVQETQAQCPSNDLSSCLLAVQADVQPSEECCTNLAEYANTPTPTECLCEAATSSPVVNEATLQNALKIPQKCNLQYPAGSTCEGYVIPGGQ